jgi:hypothetical protein
MIVECYKSENSKTVISQLPMHRDWMNSNGGHAYNCFPMSLANTAGWAISFTEDVIFTWDGVSDTTNSHVEIIKGSEFAHPNRANRTISFETGLYFSPVENISLLTMPPPNFLDREYMCLSTVISTSVLMGTLPIAVVANRSNKKIMIKAGEIVASIIPISMSHLNSIELVMKNGVPIKVKDATWKKMYEERGSYIQSVNSVGKWSRLYRNAIDHLGNSHGEHEAKRIKMVVRDEN